MAIQWADNFDNYGVTESFLLDGIYAERSSSTTLETDPDVGATGKVIKQLGTDGATSAPYNASAILRKIYNSGITTAGMSVRLWCNALPSNDNALCGIQFTDGSNARQVCIRLQSTGALQVSTGAFSPTTVGGGTPGTAQSSSGPVISLTWILTTATVGLLTNLFFLMATLLALTPIVIGKILLCGIPRALKIMISWALAMCTH
jgi:hypothetical protein